jgi:hypothetical protein
MTKQQRIKTPGAPSKQLRAPSVTQLSDNGQSRDSNLAHRVDQVKPLNSLSVEMEYRFRRVKALARGAVTTLLRAI